jgi:hypothetical protein
VARALNQTQPNPTKPSLACPSSPFPPRGGRPPLVHGNVQHGLHPGLKKKGVGWLTLAERLSHLDNANPQAARDDDFYQLVHVWGPAPYREICKRSRLSLQVNIFICCQYTVSLSLPLSLFHSLSPSPSLSLTPSLSSRTCCQNFSKIK